MDLNTQVNRPVDISVQEMLGITDAQYEFALRATNPKGIMPNTYTTVYHLSFAYRVDNEVCKTCDAMMSKRLVVRKLRPNEEDDPRCTGVILDRDSTYKANMPLNIVPCAVVTSMGVLHRRDYGDEVITIHWDHNTGRRYIHYQMLDNGAFGLLYRASELYEYMESVPITNERLREVLLPKKKKVVSPTSKGV